MYAHNNSQVNMSSGSVGAWWVYDSSQVTISGGSVGGELHVHSGGQITMSGGTVGGKIGLWTNDAELIIDGFEMQLKILFYWIRFGQLLEYLF